MKKALKIISISLLVIILLLIAIPLAFESQIKDAVKNYVNNNVNAQVDFADVNLSLLSSFPKASLSIEDLSIINNEPFKGETLATAKSLSLEMPVKDLFKKAGDEPIQINEIILDEALLTLKTDKFGNNNYDIAKSSETTDAPKDSSGNTFTFDIEDYAINKSAFNYLDEKSGIKIIVTDLNHEGAGNFSTEVSELDTSSEARVSLEIDSTSYLSNNNVKLNALIDLDLENSKYTFKENTGFINNLPLKFNGYVKQLESGQDIDITFENPESSFKDFLAVIPTEYSKNIENVATTGNFKVNGKIKGVSNRERIPNIDINIVSNNASFKYPDLPKSVEGININASVKNDTGLSDDTYVLINDLKFKIDADEFKGNATLKNLTKNMLVNANIDGILNLANINMAYPIELENDLQGILKGKLNTSFDMNAIETNAYERIKNNGNVTISDFVFSSDEIINPINISKATVNFKPGTATLESFNAVTGKSDLAATGSIQNLLGFLLSDKKLQGNFNVNSNSFAVSDFMVEGTSENNSENTSEDKPLKIPSFLDATINANAKTVIYDNLKLKDVKGQLKIKDETATLENVTSSLFDGKIALKGNVNTAKNTPVFNMNLGINDFDISESFSNLELLQTLAPIAKVLQGKLNTTINLSGNLTNDYTPEISSISGDAFAEVLTSNIIANSDGVIEKLKGALNFIEFDKLDLKDLKTKLKFENGQVTVAPFTIKYKDIDITVDGSHGFDKTLNYNAVLNVPAKYLGSDVNRLIGKINDPEINKITIPVTANITGNYKSPSIKTDLTSGITNLTKQLIEIEKQKLIGKGKDKIKDVLSDILGGKEKQKDSTDVGGTSTQVDNPLEDDVKDVLGGILGGTSKPKDSTQTDTTNSDPIKDVLGGLLGKKKKKKDTISKDSVN